MKIIKYNSYLLFFVILFLGFKPHTLYTWDLGGKIGATFQSFYRNSTNNASEFSGFGGDVSLYGRIVVHPRILLLSEVGVSVYSMTVTPYIGFTAGFIIYPSSFLPFIGLNVKEQYYTKIFTSGYHWVTSLSLTLGSDIFHSNNHTVSLFFDYLILQNIYNTFNSSRFNLNLAYSYKM